MNERLMKGKKDIYIYFLNKRYYNPPSKRKWSKQNDKYKTRRPLAEDSNVHKINIKGEYWKQKHVNKQFVVEHGNQDMINERTSLNFFGYPNISLYNKLGGSLYIEQMDQVTLCIMIHKCIKENICDSFIWKNLLKRCTDICHKMDGNILSYIFKYTSKTEYYNHYFYLTMLGNISSNLYSFNIKNCSNILFGMNNNNNYYNEEIFNKIIEHASLLILNRNDIDINNILSIISSFTCFNNENKDHIIQNKNYISISKNVNNSYLLFDCISKTFHRYDLDLSEYDNVCSSLLVYCFLDRINLFFQERSRKVVNMLMSHLNNNIEKLNIKHISIFSYATTIFNKNLLTDNLNNYILPRIEKDCYLLDNNYLSILFYSLKDYIWEKKERNKRIYNIIYNNLLNDIHLASLDSICLITYSFLKCGKNKELQYRENDSKQKGNQSKDEINKSSDMCNNYTDDNVSNKNSFDCDYIKYDNNFTKQNINLMNMDKGKKQNNNIIVRKKNKEKNDSDSLTLSYSFNLFNDFLYGKIKYNIKHFNMFQLLLIIKGLYESRMLINNKMEELKLIILKEIQLNVYNVPIHLLSYFIKMLTQYVINNKELIICLKNVSIIYLHIYKKLYLVDSDYTLNDKTCIIQEYYNNIGNSDIKKKEKDDLWFIYNEKKKEINSLSDKYRINMNLFKKQFKYLNENLDIKKEEIEKVFSFSQNYFFNYYLKEKELANFFYFCTIMEKENAIIYFNQIKAIVKEKIINDELKFSPKSILYIFKSLDYMNMIDVGNQFFNLLLKQLFDKIFSVDISLCYEFLLIFYKNKISNYYFLKKAKHKLDMNR
ncbi:hypothetical protein PFMG_03634 [Plasmodium falciparum IGH-CR14]|nr:hypothetical protein PFFVO_04715 [Plasmodium falciparum Vietnam Oak-Knoll (FVO)]EWC86194.1 hypothetical protein PFNF54_04925 [Plasmodium falciparum NF54]KNG77575.1 hypothetical protein PFMG_03634 [Plasmodium falciparum IGH-CR14]KOB86689.1 hypothetical protein PFDG_02212 [Plasmodium falciparum Dd2]